MKKLNKFFAILVALAMMATLCVSMAFAADGEKLTKAPLVKTLTVPTGTAIPAGAKAVFKFSDVLVNGAASDRASERAFLTTKTINLDTDAGAATPRNDSSKNVDVYIYTTEDLLAGINWERPGVYEWTVSEATFTAEDNNTNTVDHADKDNSSYKIVVKVIYDESTKKYIVDEVIIKDGQDGSDGQTTYDDNHTANGVTFANTYYTTTGNDTVKPGDPEDSEKPDVPGDSSKDNLGLSVDKVVEGTYGDTNKQFDFEVDLVLPQIAGADSAEAVIRRASGDIEAVTVNNGKNPIKLAHGDKLVFTKLAEGTKVTVNETDSLVGTASNQYTATYTGNATAKDTQFAIGKTANSVTVTNKANQDTISPTGILISNLPYIALALVAVGGLVAYVVVRRKADDEA